MKLSVTDGCAAVVVAAGRGERLGGDVPKALIAVGGRPLVAHAVAGLRAVGIRDVVVVHPVDAEASFEAALVDLDPLRLVPGGATRRLSVRAGLDALPAGTVRVAVHDAARGLQPPDVIAAAIAAVDGGVVAAAPSLAVTDTLKSTAGDRITGTVDRSSLVAIQTPQVVVLEVLRAAHAAGGDATDDLGLVERWLRAGHGTGQVRHVAGSSLGRKVTRGEDVVILEALLEQQRNGP